MLVLLNCQRLKYRHMESPRKSICLVILCLIIVYILKCHNLKPWNFCQKMNEIVLVYVKETRGALASDTVGMDKEQLLH